MKGNVRQECLLLLFLQADECVLLLCKFLQPDWEVAVWTGLEWSCAGDLQCLLQSVICYSLGDANKHLCNSSIGYS